VLFDKSAWDVRVLELKVTVLDITRGTVRLGFDVDKERICENCGARGY
jgi:hypothetical protein